MSENQNWWHQPEIGTAQHSNTTKNTYEFMGRREEQVLINRRDITDKKDAWDIEEFITTMYVKQLLRHPAFQMLLALLLVTNAITIALRTNSYLGQKLKVILGYIVFWVFLFDGWNILNFLIVFMLFLGLFIKQLDVVAVTYPLRALRLVHVCMAVEPLANIIRVILQSVPDLANVVALILFFMLVFSVFGVTLFGAFVPKHFQNMGVALYTLFICITQDGWLDIYSDFQMENREIAMEVGGAIYFATFITIGAFIGLNLFVVVVTTNLEQMMKIGEQGQQRQITFTEIGADEDDFVDDLPLVHCTEARKETSGHPQEPLVGGPLCNLTEKTCDNFCLVLEAIQENLREYKQIREELDKIVEEVRSIRYNQEQEKELLLRHASKSLSSQTDSSLDIREVATQQDLISALVSREKVHDSSTNMLSKHKFSF
ncbi:cation channel sperm-associated protein 4 isoform X1 [Cricetulus griseus]|uniref:cation channel sperm-associated protein 4 isoform X1 n=1 Tax=Cricetulus griseus TaxID=10029 RepID=UPI00022F60E9|nr:cation channel sperm-associated protein 4 isoform X1 [Cricetulus griseus]